MPRLPAGAIRSERAGCPTSSEQGRFDGLLQCGGRLDPQRDWAPMLDLLCAAANKGTGRRAALAVPTFGKTGTSQDNRDALFIGFAGNLVVGVWVGRDDDKPLGKKCPAEPCRRRSGATSWSSALAVDGRVGPALPAEFRVPERAQPSRERRARCRTSGARARSRSARSSGRSRSSSNRKHN